MYYETLSVLIDRERRPEVRNTKEFHEFVELVGTYYIQMKQLQVIDDHKKVEEKELERKLIIAKMFEPNDIDTLEKELDSLRRERKTMKDLLIQGIENIANQLVNGSYLRRWHKDDAKRKFEMKEALQRY